MVQLARGFAPAESGNKPLNSRWRQGFQTMSRGVRVLTRPETSARVRGQPAAPRRSPPDVVFFKRDLRARKFAAVADAGVTPLATIYHACHRETCDVGDGRSFEVVNSMEILGEGLGRHSEDLHKRLKLIGDTDDIIVETSPPIAEHGLDLDTVRDALFHEFGGSVRGTPASR